MDMLYISALASETVISEIYKKTQTNPGFAVQKFSRLLVRGLGRNQIGVTAFSIPPITKEYTNKLWINLKNETENGVAYKYMPFINFPIVKHIWVFMYSFFYVLRWGIKTRDKKAVMCDVLCISSSMGSLLASKICGIKSVAVVTDIYEQMVGEKVSGMKAVLKHMAGFFNKRYVHLFDKYVLLTEAMNEVVNPKGRPYIVMEALCDKELIKEKHSVMPKDNPRVIMYAGGLEKKYGLKMLVDAFMTIQGDDIELHLYGSGTYVKELIKAAEQDARIKYYGVRPNEEIIAAELRATLLVNPRFTVEEFTRYSFPSKNMEYMVSGTPMLTTKLPGMPTEYYPHVFLIEEETIDGYAQAIMRVMKESSNTLAKKGNTARDFVLNNKNNVYQSARILELLEINKCSKQINNRT